MLLEAKQREEIVGRRPLSKLGLSQRALHGVVADGLLELDTLDDVCAGGNGRLVWNEE